MKGNNIRAKNVFSHRERTIDTQEVADSSSAEPTTSQGLTSPKGIIIPPFDLLIHEKPRRNGRHLVGRGL